MKNFLVLTLIAAFTSLTGMAIEPVPVNFRVEKQAMSTPMTPLEDIFFNYSYFEKPININFDGQTLNMYYDSNKIFLHKNVSKIECTIDFDDDQEVVKRYLYTVKENPSDTIMLVVDYDVPYIQLVIPAKNSTGEQIGYTSYQKFISIEEIASR